MAPVDEVEAKKQRKAAKKAAAAAAAEAEAAAEVEAPKKAKKAKKQAAEEAAPVEEIDEAEAKRQRKAAKKAAKEAAAAAEAAPAEEEVDEAEAKRKRKAAKKAAKEAAAAAEEEEEAPKAKKSKKAVAEEEDEPAGRAKPTVQLDDKNALKVFVRGLPWSADEKTLRKDFGECGEIEDFQLPLNEEGKPKGIAFIKYSTQEGFDAALKFNETDYGGRTIFVSKAGEGGKGKDGKGKDKGKGDGKGKDGKGERNNELTVFIRGLPFSAEEATITKDFTECGEIESLRLPMNEEGRPRGICFIKYKTQEGMDAALKFDSTDYGGRVINVSPAGEGAPKGKDGKGKGKDGKGKDGKGKDGKGKGKKGKGKAPSESFAKSSGCIVAGEGKKATFDDSDDE